MRLATALICSYLMLAGIVAVVGGTGFYTGKLVTQELHVLTEHTAPKLLILSSTLSEYRRMQQEGLGLSLLAHDTHQHHPHPPANKADTEQHALHTDHHTPTAEHDAAEETASHDHHNHQPSVGSTAEHQHDDHHHHAEDEELAADDDDEMNEAIEEEGEELEEAYRHAQQLLNTYERLADTPSERAVAKSLLKKIHALYVAIIKQTTRYASGEYASTVEDWERLESSEEEFEEIIQHATDDMLAKLTNQERRAEAVEAFSNWVKMLATGLAVLFAVIFGYVISHRVARPIEAIENGAKRLGQGDLNTRIPVGGPREVKSLATEFNQMGEQLLRRREAEQKAQRELEQTNALLRQANDRALAAAQAKCDFLANVSHEIRTPMAAILGYTETLLEPELEKAEHKNAVRTIQRNGDFLLQIINDILDLSKIESGMFEINCMRYSLVQIIAEVESLMQIKARTKNLPLSVAYLTAVPETIETDPMRLRQILLNLIGNAIKFTETGGVRLEIRFVQQGASPILNFSIIDTGIGIAKADLDKLFKPFTQADTSTTREYGGTGLGLSISKRLAELMGGDITVQSEHGVGSTFQVTVPTGRLNGVQMIKNPGSVVQPTPAADNAENSKQELQARILLAEDGPDNQRLISRVLTKAGAKVEIVENGQLAVEAALAAREAGEAYDVILMDMQMPVMDGYEATHTLRDHAYGGPIVALTAHAMSSDRQKCLDAGCDDYATKPIKRQALIGLISRLMQYSVPPDEHELAQRSPD